MNSRIAPSDADVTWSVEMIDDPPTPKSYDKALFEAALRLAWYSVTHGDPPENIILWLTIVSWGLHPTDEKEKLLALARDIRDNLLGVAG